MDLLLLFNKLKKIKLTNRLQNIYSHLQYANNVDKKYEENNRLGFERKC